jgi:hypothetical protein
MPLIGQKLPLAAGSFLAAHLNLRRSPSCGGELKVMAAILESAVMIERILKRLACRPGAILGTGAGTLASCLIAARHPQAAVTGYAWQP